MSHCHNPLCAERIVWHTHTQTENVQLEGSETDAASGQVKKTGAVLQGALLPYHDQQGNPQLRTSFSDFSLAPMASIAGGQSQIPVCRKVAGIWDERFPQR